MRLWSLNDRIVLCYHGVGHLAAGTMVHPDDLDWQLGWLVRRGYQPATFADAVLAPPRGRVVAVSFDDGHISVLNEALPVLSRHRLVGSVFPRLDELGRPGSLALSDLEFLVSAGWEVGSHTQTHPLSLTTLTDGELRRELSESRREWEHLLGIPCRSIAYPCGDADDRVIAAAAAAGYEAGAGVFGVPIPPGSLAWPRVGVDGGEGSLHFRLRTSLPFRSLRSSRGGTRLAEAVGNSNTARLVEALAQRVQR